MSAIVTVCVLTYNPDWTRLRNTLRSIICQKNIDFDIVIADDGSKVDCFDKVDSYFCEKGFRSYQFIKNIENQGTVKNAISALQHTNAKYVKMISPGDFLYDENVLAEFVAFAEKNPAAAYFGNAVYYSVDEKNGIKIYDDKRNPKDLTPWIEQNYQKIRRNYILRTDYILGAALLCNRDVFYEYVKRLDGVVRYLEDFSIVWMIAAQKRVLYIDRILVFYEYGSGISTNTAEIWASRLNEDNEKGFQLAYRNNDLSRLEFLSLCLNRRSLRFFYKWVLDPMYVFYRLKKTKVENAVGSVEDCLRNLERILEGDQVS